MTSSVKTTDGFDPAAAAIARRAAALLGRPVEALHCLHGGRNSRVYKVIAGGEIFAAKLYPEIAGDARDRLGAESAALSLLSASGIGVVPRMIASDQGMKLAIFQWVEGTPIAAPTTGDLEQAADFSRALYRLARRSGTAVGLASEACLSGKELAAQVESRFARLRSVADVPELRVFLADEAGPVCADALRRARAASFVDASFDRDLAESLRTLSPSDFGFHNALRRADGRIVFLDFEYFGWDDPVKLAADFLLHPGMALDRTARNRFAALIREVFATDSGFDARLQAFYPLYGLRWCAILLNPLLPERRTYGVEIESRQLVKARAMLRRVAEGESPW